jgi:hypothetical protein
MRIEPLFLRVSLLLPICLLLASAPVAAQVSEKEKVQQELEQRLELERKTLALLDDIAAGAWSLKLSENRSFVLASVADLLWASDEKRARNLFWEALNNLSLMNSPVSSEAAKNSAANKTQTQNQFSTTFGLRRDFLRKVARRDPQLALDMLRATRQTPPELNLKYRLPDESDLEQEIASEVAARDPQRALQIARESLAKGVKFELLNLLFQLNERDTALASEFAGDIIDKLQTENIETNVYGPLIAIQLLEFSRASRDASLAEGQALVRSHRLKLSEEQRRDLVELLTNAALSATAGNNVISNLSGVMPEIEQYAPGKVAPLQRKLAEINRSLNKEQQEWNTYNALYTRGNAEEMLKAAATASDERRESLYREAVLMAVMRGTGDSLREFINKEIPNQSRRNELIDSLDAEQIGYAAYRGETDKLRELLPQIRLKEQRARAMAEVAVLLEKKGQHDDALALLDEAQTLIKTDLRSETQSEALLALILGYALVNPAKAFAIIEPVIDRVNDEISKALLVDKIVKSGFVKKNEIIMTQPGIPMDFAMFKYGKGVSALASADFDRTRAMADRFQRNELRIMARLLLAQALIQSRQPGEDKPTK